MKTDAEINAHLDRRELAHFRADARAEARMDRRYNDAYELVGELCREGRTVFYINVRSKTGRLTGAIREFAHRADAVDFLIRNRYA